MSTSERFSGEGARPLPALFMATGAYLALCLILGGASQANDLFDLILRLAGVPLLVFAGIRLTYTTNTGAVWPALALLASLALLPLLQLIPLPFDVWSALPGRASIAADLHVAGAVARWMPLSLAPEGTLDALFGLIPFAAVLVAALGLSPDERWRLWAGTAVLAFLSVALGALQLAGGAGGELQFYGGRRGEAVGFFANRNHWAAWLAASLPILAYGMSRSRRGGQITPLAIAILLAVFVALLAGVAISGSRAGAALLLPAVLGSIVLLWRQGGRGGGARRILLPAVVAAAGLVFAVVGAWAAAARFAGTDEDLRFDLWVDTVRLALTYFPFGSGGGSFSAVYAGQEVVDTLTAGFANQAHNDWVEVFLEYGLAALLPVTLFAVLLIKAMQRGGAVPFMVLALVVLLAASFVDYPLRTPALQALMALLLAGQAGWRFAASRR